MGKEVKATTKWLDKSQQTDFSLVKSEAEELSDSVWTCDMAICLLAKFMMILGIAVENHMISPQNVSIFYL